jgi:hypothetical protein
MDRRDITECNPLRPGQDRFGNRNPVQGLIHPLDVDSDLAVNGDRNQQ